jgi:lipopolysaccharide transport system permease protein
MATIEHQGPQTLVIRPPGRWSGVGLRDVWRFRELLLFLTWRDVKVRYKQTLLGAAWALVQPFVTMIVFNFVLHRAGGIKTAVPYPLFSLTGLALWFYFANSLNLTSNSLVANSALITKVYFPRLTIALSPLLAGLVDLTLALVLVAGAMAVYGVVPPAQIVLAPLFVLLALATALGIGLILSSLNVRYRDVRYAVPFLVQIGLFASPVGYPATAVHGIWRTMYSLNPLTGILEGFRWSVLGVGHPSLGMLAISTVSAVALVVVGVLYFARTERTFADVI